MAFLAEVVNPILYTPLVRPWILCQVIHGCQR